MSKPKKLPKFKTQINESDFWQEHDSADYLDWSKAKKSTFPNLKPSVKTISLRIPENLLNAIKVMANKDDIPYQSLMKILLAKAVQDSHKHR